MDRTDAQNYIDIGGGRRGFRDQNVDAGVPGTRVTAAFLNSLQEEIMAVIENAGFTAEKANWQQLDAAIRKLSAKIVNDHNIPLAQLNCLPWLPVISLTQKTPPAKPTAGDIYVVPDDGKGEWSDKASQIAEWNGSKWLFSSTKDGHGIGRPDGSIYIKIAGKYVLLTDLLDSRYSRLIAPPADTFYVVGPSGSDKNSGLKPTPEDGFATIQGAIDVLSVRYITQGTITLKISDGNYDGVIINSSLVANWRLVGNELNPSAVRLNGTDSAKKNVRGLIVYASTNVAACGLTFCGYDGGAATSGGSLELKNCNVISPAAKSDTAVAFAVYGGSLRVFGKIRITGSFYSVFIADQCGSMRVGETFANGINSAEITYQNVSCAAANFSVQNSGSITITSPVVKFIGTPDGAAYGCSFNGTIMSVGGGANFIPGSRPGWTGTGGQFV